MSWTIRIPHRSRDESLIDVASHARTLGPDEGPVTRQLVIQARLDGVATTAGELLDHLEQLEPSERRALLDQARAAAGREPTGVVDARERIHSIHSINRVQLAQGLQQCHADGCMTIPTDENGAWRVVNVRRWHCDQHLDQADDGDMRDLGFGVRYSESGALIPDDPAADAAEAERHATDRARRRAQAETRAVEAADMRAAREKRDAAARTELPEHLRGAA